MMNERLRSRRYPPRTDDKAARESADPDLRVARAPPSDRGRPVEADCGDVQPEPSHVINTRYWECLNDLCTIWDASVMNLIVQARLDTQVIGDDLQVRMSRLTCQQRNINSQLTFLRDMGVRRAGAVSPAVTTQADRPYRALGRVQPREGEPQTPQLSICETARNARARGSPAAPGLERQCRAQGGE
jgi:hypothetical protein